MTRLADSLLGRLGAAALLGLASGLACGQHSYEAAPAERMGAGAELSVHGATDPAVMAPLLAAFEQLHPGTRVDYQEYGTIDLYDEFLADLEAGRPVPDLLLSPAMDLQTKLANDGHALSYQVPNKGELPPGSIWRDEAFAVSLEPVVIVYNTKLIPPEQVPTSRYRLLEVLVRHPHRYYGRIGVYDPALSASGYLYFTQDAEQSPVLWELVQEFGALGATLHDRAREILVGVATGDLLIGYNVPGSYAMAWAELNPSLGIVLPEDYTLVISRIAIIPKRAPHPELAGRFLEFLLSEDGQRQLAEPSQLRWAQRAASGQSDIPGLPGRQPGLVRPVRMGPGLLVYVDQLKRENFLRRWLAALREQRPALP